MGQSWHTFVLSATKPEDLYHFPKLTGTLQEYVQFQQNLKKKCSRASLNETRHYNLNIFCSILHDLDHYAHVLIMSQLNGDGSELMQFDLSQFRLQFWSAHVRQHTHWRLDKARSYDTHVLSESQAQHRVRVRTAKSKRPI